MTNALLLAAIIAVESGGNDNARGDHGASIGALQIQAPVVRDVNRHFGTSYRHIDMTNRTNAVFVFNAYMSIYATSERLGRAVTDADRVRIWNGGPDGWRRACTIKYANRIMKRLHL